MSKMRSCRREFLRKATFFSTGSILLPGHVFTVSGKKVSLLGDSIRIGYQWQASLYINKQAEVWGPEENTRHTVHLLDNVHKWLKNYSAHIIHINSGLHDIKCIPFNSRDNLIPLEQYKENIERIIKYIHRHQPKAAIIWAATTPVLDERVRDTHEPARDFMRYNEDVLRYNEAAEKVTTRLGVPFNDLYEFVMSGDPSRIMAGDGVHFTDTGNQFLGEQVANAVNEFL